MNIQTSDLSETRKQLVVTLDPGEVAAEHSALVGEFVKQAKIPGFRPGKAPAAMVEKRFLKEIGDELSQRVVNRAYKDGLEQAKIDALRVVDVKPGTVNATEGATITFSIDVRPSFTLPDYAGLTTEVAPVEPTDAEIDTIITGLRSERADFKVAERASQKSDFIKLAYSGTVDGQPVSELVPDKQIYAAVPQTWEEVGGQEGLIPGLGAQLEGLAANDKRDVTVTFPAEFTPAPALAGKTAIYAVTVLEVRERVLPEINEAFLKDHKVDSLETLRTNIRNNLKARKEFENRQAQRRQVTDALLAGVEFAVPESLVEAETQTVLRQFIDENMRRGVPAEQFEKDKAQLIEGARKAAAGRAKAQLILARIAEQEKIEVTNDDLNRAIYAEAQRTNQKPDALVKELQKNRDRVRALQQSIIFDKALELVVSKASVSILQPQA